MVCDGRWLGGDGDSTRGTMVPRRTGVGRVRDLEIAHCARKGRTRRSDRVRCMSTVSLGSRADCWGRRDERLIDGKQTRPREAASAG